MRARLGAIVIMAWLAAPAWAHTMMPTRVLVSFESPVQLDVRIDIDLTLMLGSPERYYELVTEPGQKQQTNVQQILPKLMDTLQLLHWTAARPIRAHRLHCRAGIED